MVETVIHPLELTLAVEGRLSKYCKQWSPEATCSNAILHRSSILPIRGGGGVYFEPILKYHITVKLNYI